VPPSGLEIPSPSDELAPDEDPFECESGEPEDATND